jgi:hypothetical protein
MEVQFQSANPIMGSVATNKVEFGNIALIGQNNYLQSRDLKIDSKQGMVNLAIPCFF